MTMLVSLDQAKDHLRIDSDSEDSDLALKIYGASKAVLNYMKSASVYEPERDETGAVVIGPDGLPVYSDQVLFEVQAAVLLMLGFLYKDRDVNADNAFEQGYLPKPVTALLYSLRDPALA